MIFCHNSKNGQGCLRTALPKKSLKGSKINEKMYYANESLIENMCEDEAFGIFELGYVEDYKKITNDDVVKNYYRMLRELPIYIFVSGNVSNDEIMEYTECFRNL